MKKVCRILVVGVLVLVLTHVVHALTLDKILQYRQITFSSAKIPAQMDGYLIAFVVDTHQMSSDDLVLVVSELNTRGVDLLLLGGDFRSSERTPLQTMDILSRVHTTDGIFGIEGNHDWYQTLFAAMEACGITPLSNEGVHIREGFYLGGVEELWNRRPDVAMAINGAEPDDFTLLLAHNPDLTMLQDTTGVDLILSGHTHGGQMTFLGWWAPYFTFDNGITAYGQRFRSGWSQSRDSTPVYVSNGAGDYFP